MYINENGLYYRQVVYNTESHIRIMELLLLHGKWGEKLPEFASAPALPPRKVSRPHIPSIDQDMEKERNSVDSPRSLQEAEWYWGDINRYGAMLFITPLENEYIDL